MKKIALLTSGGDAPGMNACIRAVVRGGIYNRIEVTGIMRGFEGMIDGDFIKLESTSVSNIIQRGGTILKTARSSRFMNGEGRKLAYENLAKAGIEGVIAIGGDGTFRGGSVFNREYNIPFIGIPGTIDNDLAGTDYTIGYDTAINTVVTAVDKIRDTAASHDRLFFVEVMGRDAGCIALLSGIGVGAEAILIPESKTYIDKLISTLERGWKRQKMSSIIIVSEGDDQGGAYEIAKKVKEKFNNYDTRVSVLGHMQRGGSPTCMDRILATRLGLGAVEAFIAGKTNVMIGMINHKIVFTPFEKAIKHRKRLDEELVRLTDILSI